MSSFPVNPQPISTSEARQMSPLVLAFVGDSVHTLWVRQILITTSTMRPNALHKQVSDMVKASAQAEQMQAMLGELTEDEMDIYHRGRNAKVHTIAKNASVADYKQATAFECLVGYLYLTGQNQRLEQLIRR